MNTALTTSALAISCAYGKLMQSARCNTMAKMDLKKFDIIEWTRLLSPPTHGPVVPPVKRVKNLKT
jgi:hypothetical protein